MKAEVDKFRAEMNAEMGTQTKQENEEPDVLTKEEIEELRFLWANERFGEVLKGQKNTKGVIIFYADNTRLDIKKIKQHIEEGKRRIAKSAKISPDELQVIYGGYREIIQAEFWVVPKNDIEPILTREERKT